MESTGELPISSSEASVESPEKPAVKEGGQRKRKRREYEEEDDEKEDELPERYKHIRISERKVREEVYQTFADLSGQGLSMDECSTAIVFVGNGLFGRKWSKAGENETFNKNTLPGRMPVLDALRQI